MVMFLRIVVYAFSIFIALHDSHWRHLILFYTIMVLCTNFVSRLTTTFEISRKGVPFCSYSTNIKKLRFQILRHIHYEFCKLDVLKGIRRLIFTLFEIPYSPNVWLDKITELISRPGHCKTYLKTVQYITSAHDVIKDFPTKFLAVANCFANG